MTMLPRPVCRSSILRGDGVEDMGVGFKMSSCVGLIILSWLRLGRACLLLVLIYGVKHTDADYTRMDINVPRQGELSTVHTKPGSTL